jgi:hypothetical protein
MNKCFIPEKVNKDTIHFTYNGEFVLACKTVDLDIPTIRNCWYCEWTCVKNLKGPFYLENQMNDGSWRPNQGCSNPAFYKENRDWDQRRYIDPDSPGDPHERIPRTQLYPTLQDAVNACNEYWADSRKKDETGQWGCPAQNTSSWEPWDDGGVYARNMGWSE